MINLDNFLVLSWLHLMSLSKTLKLSKSLKFNQSLNSTRSTPKLYVGIISSPFVLLRGDITQELIGCPSNCWTFLILRRHFAKQSIAMPAWPVVCIWKSKPMTSIGYVSSVHRVAGWDPSTLAELTPLHTPPDTIVPKLFQKLLLSFFPLPFLQV